MIKLRCKGRMRDKTGIIIGYSVIDNNGTVRMLEPVILK